MKLAFSTSACPDLNFDRIMMTAKSLRFDGIEVEGINNETYLPKTTEFSQENLVYTKKILSANNIEIPLLASHTQLSDIKNKIKLMQEPYEYIDLAERAGIEMVRVFGDKNKEPFIDDHLDMFFVMENLRQVCEYAKPKGITILVETNGMFSDSRLLARMLRDIDCKNVGVLWNVNNTVRYSFEPPEQTAAVFGNKLKYVHINDTVQKVSSLEFKPLGRGDLPLKDILNTLIKTGFNGYLSLDWPRRTHPELLDPETILPQFMYYIKNMTE